MASSDPAHPRCANAGYLPTAREPLPLSISQTRLRYPKRPESLTAHEHCPNGGNRARGMNRSRTSGCKRGDITEFDRSALVSSAGFDAAVWESWPCLVSTSCTVAPVDEAGECADLPTLGSALPGATQA